MDDLDHSMHIAEHDWVSFYEESEECGLLQPSLACPDNLSLSDSEESGNSSSVFIRGPGEPQRPAANSDEVESNAAGCCMEEEQISLGGTEEGQDNLTPKAEKDIKTGVDSHMCLNYPQGNTINTEGLHTKTGELITEEKKDNTSTTLQTEQLIRPCSDGESAELKKGDGDMQMGSESSSIHEADLLSHRLTELNVNEPQMTDRAMREEVSSVASRAEKERWFVTVNDNPARQRVRDNVPVKKKRRQKKTCKNNNMCQTAGQEKSLETGLKEEKPKDINEHYNESEGWRDTEIVTQNTGGNPSNKENPESTQREVNPDLFQVSLTFGEEDTLSEKLITSHNIQPTADRNNHNPSSTSFRFTPTDPSRLDSVESDELGDSVEFFSTHSYDSENYLSATESVEDPQHLQMENQQLQSSSLLFNLTENANVDNTHHREMDSCHSTLSCNVAATDCEGYESVDVDPSLTFPSVAQSASKMPDDNSTCNDDSHSMPLRMSAATPGLQKHEINLTASGCSSGEQLSLPAVPDVTPTPCSVADSPETYAEAAGHTRPVFAISAFWDEMEKLTINDILQLRMGRGTPPMDTKGTVTSNVDDFSTNHSSLVDTVESNLSDGGLLDTSDTADSDYFTQPDESKPDRSSCEFSTSDFEEEYWQFLGASRNASPDSQNKNQQRTGDSPLFAREEEESTSSEGKETPVPSEDLEGECFEDQDSNAFIPSELAWPRQLMKSKSVCNVQALNTEDVSLQLLLGNDKSSLFLSSCPSLEEHVVLKASDSPGTLLPAHFLFSTDVLHEHTPVSFPELSDFFTEDEAKRDSWCVTVYDPEDISVAPVFDYTLCTLRDETSFPSLPKSRCGEEKPIPIFSCSHPTVRELTIPNPDYVFLSADCEDEYDISPIRVVSQSFVQGSDRGRSEKHRFQSWKSLLSWRIRFHDKGSIWCRRSGAWVFPVEAGKNTSKTAGPPLTVVTEGRGCSTPSQLFRELAVQQRILETIQATRQEGLFSTLQQSDMCLVCIAFASWVLKSSDPEAADAWKAALLANVSALSAIQYLRHYMKKRNPCKDDL